MQVPFLDLATHHEPLRLEIEQAIGRVLDSSAFAGGPFVAQFEREFAAYCGSSHAVGVGSGTEALWLTLLALGVGPGDEVVTVPHTFVATVEAISFLGARPVFVDINPETYTLDPEGLELAISPRTKAIVPVHIFGQTADMDPILEIAGRAGVPVVEDACQAHGAAYKGCKAGSMGIAGCFSFYPGKNLGALGEAGAVVTHSQDLCEQVRMLRDHGQAGKYHHVKMGWNGRMDGLQGAVLQVKLKHLDQTNAARRAHAALYRRLLDSCASIGLPHEASYALHVYHLFVVRVAERDKVLADLADRGVACGVHYPKPVHLQPAYRALGYSEGSFPVAERCAREYLSLPMYPELSPRQVEHVARALRSVVAPMEIACDYVG